MRTVQLHRQYFPLPAWRLASCLERFVFSLANNLKLTNQNTERSKQFPKAQAYSLNITGVANMKRSVLETQSAIELLVKLGIWLSQSFHDQPKVHLDFLFVN
jgi:hypothetical protein